MEPSPAGQAILIEAIDNFLVLSVHLVIRRGETIIEEGDAELDSLA